MTTVKRKHEVLAGAAIKCFLAMLEAAPLCELAKKRGDSLCPLRRHLMKELKQKNRSADKMFAELFNQVL